MPVSSSAISDTDNAASTARRARRSRRGPFKMHRYGGWLLYFWHGMRFGTWLRLLRRGGFDVTVNCLPNILTVTLFTPLNSALYYLSEAIHRSRADALGVGEDAPIFVLGHWRTGTTLVHDLLACDPAFAAPTTYECFFPNHFLLTEGVLSRALKVFLPKKRPQDEVPVGFDRPQEEEFAYVILGLGTPYTTMAWPRHGPADSAYVDLEGLSEAERQRWIDGFLWFYRRLALKHRRPLVLKSPPHTARVKLLAALFPKARFIHIARDPLHVVPSTVRLWRALYSTQGLHNPPHMDGWIEDYVLDLFERIEGRYLADRDRIPPQQRVEIRYEDLIADPKGVLRDIYAGLDLGPLERAEPFLDAYLAARSGHKVAAYDLPPAQRERIAERLAAYRAHYGYDR